MSVQDHHEIEIQRTPWAREALRWGAATLVVCATHGAAAYGVIALAPEPEPMAVQEAMNVELTPLVVSTAEPVIEDAASEELPELLAENPELPSEQPAVEEPDTAEPEKVEPLETAEETDPIAETPEAVVVLPQPRPEIVQEVVEVEKPKPRKVVKTPVVEAEKRPTKSHKSTAGASRPSAPRVSPNRWYVQVQSAIARRKPRSLGESGRVSVRFVVNQSGNIVSSGIARTSGSARLDQAALSMVRGARVPAPPEGSGITSHPFTIPVTFE
ncbi:MULTISPECIES: energy transducer TonB family protein [Mesorhizobium]|uniref:Energy transducer TonB n=1 Tax=Mesorhizobium denitrificans TaxID=2294114 RepID=A0A371XJX1_9HYPH|nr:MULTISPECIES: TonB family protein [Mesorhizobium]RFC69511.1 energy transducer TonB [Mesorhizobium denitrificans]